jgi:hypothetical protein
MSDHGYDDGPTRGGKWGCAAAAIVGAPIFFFLMLVDALGDCAPDAPCGKGFWEHVLAPSALIALAVGLGVRWIVNSRGNVR